MAGLTASGFVIKTVEDLLDEINTAIKSAFGNSVDVTGGVMARFTAIIVDRLAELWELGEAVYSSTNPNGATGARLDDVSALTGTTREEATNSTVTLTLTGTNTTVIPIGSRASVVDLGDEFETTESATLATLTSWAALTTYALGDRRTNASRSYVVITAGTSAASGGPTTTSSDITDGTVHWRYLGEGTAADDAAAQSVETGPIIAASGDITEIETPVSGWQSVINLLDADLGQDEEVDEDLRVRRLLELARPGTSPINAIRADLLQVDGVTNVTVFHNNTDTTDVDGVPPHSVEALVTGGADQDIWDQLLDSVAGGILTYGTEVGTSSDDEGNAHEMMFSRPDEIEIYVDVFVTYDAGTYPLDGDDQIKAAIVAYGDVQPTGKNAVASSIGAQAFTVAGVLDVTLVEIGTAPSPSSSTTIEISKREIAVHDTSRITVTSVAGVP